MCTLQCGHITGDALNAEVECGDFFSGFAFMQIALLSGAEELDFALVLLSVAEELGFALAEELGFVLVQITLLSVAEELGFALV